MKILVTGSKGFIGKHVCNKLKSLDYIVFEYDKYSNEDQLKEYIRQADFIVHLAGVNRPLTIDEFFDGNTNFTKKMVNLLSFYNKNTPILMTSSIQASLDNDYGRSKKLAEDYLFNSGCPVYVFRLNNVFGKWCKPNYNSVCATFCYNIAHDLPIKINDEYRIVTFNYIDDVVETFINIILQKEYKGSKEILYVEPKYDCSVGKLASLLSYFKQEIESPRHLPIIHNDFELKLFKTFCNYLNDERYFLNYSADSRGSFEELYKSTKYGQISENIGHSCINKGGHYHKFKHEIFYTVKGICRIRQRNILDNSIIENIVSGDKPEPIEIRVGYTHEITNIGKEDSSTLMWISQLYDERCPDTYKEPL